MNKQLDNEKMSAGTAKPSHRLTYIDTLRGFAACWVFLLHTHGYWLDNIRPTGINATRIITFLFGIGGFGVDLFIVLSGFCLFYPIIRNSKELKGNFDSVKFYKRRAYRLLPAYYAALLFSTLLAIFVLHGPKPVTWVDFVSYIFLVQTFSNEILPTINGSYWSIALEAQLYLFFPVLLILYKRWGMAAVVATGVVAAIIWPFAYNAIYHITGVAFPQETHLPARWIEFISGMLAALIVCHYLQKSFKWSIGIFALTLPLAIIFNMSLAARIPNFISHLIAGITFASLVVLLAHYPEKKFAGKTPIGALTGLGEISYSFYLLHQPILLLAAPFVKKLGLGVLPTFALSFVTAIPVTALLAYIFYIYIERPFLARGRQIQSTTVNTSQPLPEATS